MAQIKAILPDIPPLATLLASGVNSLSEAGTAAQQQARELAALRAKIAQEQAHKEQQEQQEQQEQAQQESGQNASSDANAGSLDITVTSDSSRADSPAASSSFDSASQAPLNSAPIGVNDVLATAEDTPIRIDVNTLLANDQDSDGDMLYFSGISGVEGGSLSVEDGELLFTPAANHNDEQGVSGFVYLLSDGQDIIPVAVQVRVAPVNDAPSVQTDQLQTTEDTTLTFAAADLLANDSDVDGSGEGSGEGSGLSVTAVTADAGFAVLNADGTVTYTPAADAFGTDTLTYRVSDGTDSATGTVNVTVSAVNDAPDVVTLVNHLTLPVIHRQSSAHLAYVQEMTAQVSSIHLNEMLRWAA